MTSAREPEKPKIPGKPGPEPERLVIDPEDAEAGLDRLLRKPEPKKGEEEDPPEESEDSAK